MPLEAGGFVPGDTVALAPVGDHWLGTFICYESAFANSVRKFVAKGANVLINISNDSWCGQ
jgi:apolipoprotein N-acyltransferase